MQTTTIKGLWKNFIPIRDVFVKRGLNDTEGLKVICGSKSWILTREQLAKPIIKKEVADYFSKEKQVLMYFLVPVEKPEVRQQKLI